MGNAGIFAGDEADIRNVRVRWNGALGIAVGDFSQVADCLAYGNGTSTLKAGIQTGRYSRIIGNNVSHDDGRGIVADVAAIVRGNVSYESGSTGIEVTSLALVTDNSVHRSQAGGIKVGGASLVADNAVRQSDLDGISIVSGIAVGNAIEQSSGDGLYSFGFLLALRNNSQRNSGDGFEIEEGLLVANAASDNGQLGIHFTTSQNQFAAYGGNSLVNNGTGATAGTAANRGDNYCVGTNVGSATCP